MSCIPPPDVQVLQLVSALSNADNHDLHVEAIRARDEALSGSVESYGNLCTQLARLLWASDEPSLLLHQMDANSVSQWQSLSELQWIQFGQLAGLILKQALLSPPILPPPNHQSLHLIPPASEEIKEILLQSLKCKSAPLRAVASTVIATAAVSPDSIQPNLTVQMWPQLLPTLLQNLNSPETVDGSLTTIRKMMEDGPSALNQQDLDALIPLLLKFLGANETSHKIASLQSIVACLEDGILPNALVLQFSDYLAGLSALATDPSPQVRQWVCRSIVTLLVLRTEYIQPHMQAISQFMLNSTGDHSAPEVALEACEFWLTFCTGLEEDVLNDEMLAIVKNLLPQLIPILLQGMVYSPEQQEALLFQNQMEETATTKQQVMRPVFHKTKHKHSKETEPESDDDEEEDHRDFDDDDDEDGNDWNLRKCSAASLDCLASLYGPQFVLPALLPELEKGLSSADVWHQEASMLALGAIADGCRQAMYPHLSQLFPAMLQTLQQQQQQQQLPQLVQICAWTMGRYAPWAVEQVQTGAQGHLVATMAEVLMARLQDKNRKVQVACCSSFGVLVEAAGDLLVPYLEPVLTHLVSALQRFQGKSLLVLFDTFGVMADFVGPAMGEGSLPGIYIPPLLHLWNETAKHNAADRLLLPLLESLASIALVCGVNYQPYALETFDLCMCTIESVTLQLTTTADGGYIDDDQDADPIVCATDLLDGMVEGLGPNFPHLVSSSTTYGQHFSTVLVALVQHEVPGVRMSAFALVGDLALKAPTVLEPALPEILKEALQGLDPTHPVVCANASWAIGEICVKCGDNPAPLEPFAPSIVQQLLPLIVGNADSMGVLTMQGATANASATMGRLAKVNPNFVAPELPRFLIGWCEGIAKISDPSERRDGFQGFVLALHANPQAIQTSSSVKEGISAILFAIVSWHMPADAQVSDMLHSSSQYTFEPFPPNETELQNSLGKLLHDIKNSVGAETWDSVHQQIPVNVRRLLRETYQL